MRNGRFATPFRANTLRQSAARHSRRPVTTYRCDHVQHLPGLPNLMCAEHAGAMPSRHRGRRERAVQPLVEWYVEGLADEVLVGQRDQNRPAGRDEFIETP